jgi:hypothetical protein
LNTHPPSARYESNLALLSAARENDPTGLPYVCDEIRGAALQSLIWDVEVPSDFVNVKVNDGWVTLKGDVSYQFESDAAYDDVASLYGVLGVTNEIIVSNPLIGRAGVGGGDHSRLPCCVVPGQTHTSARLTFAAIRPRGWRSSRRAALARVRRAR